MALDFLILYEHVVREYESIILLQLELEKRGYTAEIHQLLGRKKLKYLFNKRPKVLVSSCMYNNEALNSHVYNNVGKCKRVVNLHWEQMLSDTQEEEAWFNFDGAAKNCVQTCWGKKTQERLIKHGMLKENCPITGAVMMDFLRSEFDGYFKTKKELCKQFNLDENKKMFLYISSFGYASMTEAEVKELSQMSGVDFTGFAKTNRISMAQTLDWIDRYLTANNDVEFVYRRHPSEWACKQLEELAQKHKNFHVIFESSVKQWIVAADKIFIWMSTAVAEVYFANKTCHILRPHPIEHEYDPVIYKDAQYITNYDDFIKATVCEDAPFPIKGEVIEGYFDSSETPAYIRMANLLEEVYKTEPITNPFETKGFKPRKNILKFFALLGVHGMFAIKLNPTKFAKICKPFANFAGRIYGYIEKAYVPQNQIKTWRENINKFI